MNQPDPPRGAIRFLEWFCPPVLAEGILGDLYESFDQDVAEKGVRRARWRFIWNVIRFFRPGILLRNQFSNSIFNNNMWSNYLKIAVRNLLKRKMYSLINAFGLSVGIAFCMLIFLFIRDEQQFDRFHENLSTIYRVEEKAYDTWRDNNPGDLYDYSAYLQTGLRDVLLEEIPQIQRAARYSEAGEMVVKFEDKVITEELTYTDPDFFEMFSFPVLAGDPSTFLQNQHDIVLPVSIARRIFGNRDAIGESLILTLNGEEKEMIVVGILEDAPSNSSLDYGMLIAQQNRPNYERNLEKWRNFNTPLFIQLHENAQPSDIKESFGAIVDNLMGENLAQSREEYTVPEDVLMFEYLLNPFENIHLDTRVTWTRSSDPDYAYILSGLGILILLIACINYVSLALTSSAGRRSEVGIRKAIGARREELITQFTVESVVLALISLVIAVVLVYLFLPSFNTFTEKNIQITPVALMGMLGAGVFLSLFIGLLAGSYPSLYLSGLNPIHVLKRLSGRVKAGFTRPLVVIQYALSGLLIICSVIMLRQMKYLTTKELGYSTDQVVVIDTHQGFNEDANQFVERFQREMEKYPEITSVGATSISFARGWSKNGYKIDGEQKSAFVYAVDEHYIPTLDIELLAGRNFTASDSNVIIVNEALVADMAWEDPLNEHLNWRDDSLSQGSKVIGVARDYHFLSLEEKIEPMFLMPKNDPYGYLGTLLVRLHGDDIAGAMDLLENKWREIAPDKPFDYAFMDDDVARQYAQYDRWTSIMTLSTIFAILISCLGLFGLAGINAVNRTKEIGIRKVMGAPTWNVFVLMNRQFVFLALISFTLAAPLSWWLMDKWLSSFTYAIEISWDVFVLSILIGVAIAMLTVTYHGLRTIRLNPADTLKYE